MIDLIRFNVSGYMKPPEKLQDVRETTNKNKETIYQGYLENMFITYTERGFYGNGSLSKLFFGNNIAELNYMDIQEGAEEFSDLIDTPLSDINISSVEIGANLFMQKPFEHYYSYITGVKGYNHKYMIKDKQEKKFSQSNNRAVKFYDKVKQNLTGNTAERIPEIEGLNILRAESLLNRFNTFGLIYPEQKTLQNFIKPETLHLFTNIFHSHMERTIFMKQIKDIEQGIKTSKDFRETYIPNLVKTLCREFNLDISPIINNLTDIKERQKRNYRKKFADFSAAGDIFEPTPEEQEFRQKVSERISIFRESIS